MLAAFSKSKDDPHQELITLPNEELVTLPGEELVTLPEEELITLPTQFVEASTQCSPTLKETHDVAIQNEILNCWKD